MRGSWQFTAWMTAGLLAITIGSYWTVAACGYVDLDDWKYVSHNRNVIEGLSTAGWNYAWTTNDCSNWHPLTWLSLEFDGSFWKANPSGYHITNLVFHCANSVLVFVVLWWMTNRRDLSAWTAALFAVHPLHVESVAWISERKDVLSTFCLLLTLWAYTIYAKRPTVLAYLAVAAFLTLGLLAKPMLVTLPILLLLIDYWPLGRIRGIGTLPEGDRFPPQTIPRIILEKVPLFVLAFADGIMTVLAQHEALAPVSQLSAGVRISNMFHAFLWYLQKTFVPVGLIAMYPHPGKFLDWRLGAIGALITIGISAMAIWKARTKPHLIVGWAWFLISLAPVIGLVQVGYQSYADRYAYIPHIGLFIMLVWEVHSWFANSKSGLLCCGIAGGLAIAVCSVLTHLQVQHWKDSEALWTHALDVDPNNVFAHSSIARVLLLKGDNEQAVRHCEFAVKNLRVGNIPDAWHLWGVGLLALNREAEAEAKFRAALKIAPYFEGSCYELEKLLEKQGRFAEAAQIAKRHSRSVKQQLKDNPDDAQALIKLGLANARQGQFQQAIVEFEKAIKIAPQSASAYSNLALCQLNLKRVDQAKSNFLKAIELNPKLAAAHFSLATVLESEDDLIGAKEHFAEALKIDPNDEESKKRLERLVNR